MVRYRVVDGYPGYRVGSDGSVWSRLVRCGRRPSGIGTSWKLLKQNPAGQYATVGLCNGTGKSKTVPVHVLVLTTFRGPRPASLVGAHKNNKKRDNRLSNLRWGTQKSNIYDKRKHGTHLKGEQLEWTKLTASDVIKIRTLIGTMTLAAIGKKFSVTRHNIAMIRDRKSWSWL